MDCKRRKRQFRRIFQGRGGKREGKKVSKKKKNHDRTSWLKKDAKVVGSKFAGKRGGKGNT